MALTPKQEKFCQVYLETGNATEAYRQAYTAKGKPATLNREAKRLLDNTKIATRLSELQTETKERHDVTVDTLLRELEEARKVGQSRGQAAAMVQATMSKAKLLGIEGSDDEDTTPQAVKVTVEVKDARRDAKRDPAAA